MKTGLCIVCATAVIVAVGLCRKPAAVLAREEILVGVPQADANIEKAALTENLYPAELISALQRNHELLDFVEGYLTIEARAYGGITQAESREQCPLFRQWDARWGYAPYGEINIGLSGCGPTCLSMVLYSLTRDESLTPDMLAQRALDEGYYVEGVGTSWAFLKDIAPQYGVMVTEEQLYDEEAMKLYLGDGKLVICAMGPGDFTDTGHFIVVRGYADGKLLINDPFSRKNSTRAWEPEVIRSQCSRVWTYEAVR
nr:C39 family peptidase [uncultured Marvinbryantia sp.]